MAQLIERGGSDVEPGIFVHLRQNGDGTFVRDPAIARFASDISHYGSTLVTVTADVGSEAEMMGRVYQTALEKANEVGATWVLATPYERSISPCAQKDDAKHRESCPGSFVKATIDFYV